MQISPDRPAVLARAVLDTNVVLDLLVWNNPEADLLRRAVLERQLVCLATTESLAELRRVLGYEKLALSEEAAERIHTQYAALVEQPAAQPIFAPIPRCSDRDDQKFIDLAMTQGANLLLSRDKALLKLGKRAKKIVPQLEILTPSVWMARQRAAAR